MKRLEDRKIHFDITDRAKDLLIEEGFDPTYGARPLKRTIQREILDPLAMRVLQGDFVEGDVVSIDAAGGEIAFAKAKSLQHA
jgi:ATP-dependent Clp protease ATP-binding subunit ClpB